MTRNKLFAVITALVLVAAAASAPAIAKKGGNRGNHRGGGKGSGKLLKTKMMFKLDARHWDTDAEVTGQVRLFAKPKGKGKFAPLEGAELTIYVDREEVGTALTDADGKTIVTWGPATDGKHKMWVVFAGDDTHKGARRQQPFRVGADNGENEETPTTGRDEPAKLKSIGFNLDYYNPDTNRAGDFHFTQALANALSGDPIFQKLIWSDYGIQDNRSPNDPTKRNVQPTFRLPLGTKVLAPIDGEVTRVEILYSDDYSIWFSGNKDSAWSYEMEHVINPLVKVGDKVTAGQVVAEVSTHGSEHHPGFGIVEIGLFHPVDNEPAHWCPFVHFDDSIKDEMNKKILALYTAWETYLDDDSVYENASYPVPGCATLEPTKG